VLDSFHICPRGNPIEPTAELPGEKIALVQVADAPALVMDALSLSRHYRCYPGQGDYPIVDYLDAATRSGYRGPLPLETFNDRFRGASAASIAVDGMRSLLSAGEGLAGKRASRGDRPLPDLTPLPPPPEVHGVEFVEFAAGKTEARAMVAMIEGLGFRRAGRHRSKDVDLYATVAPPGSSDVPWIVGSLAFGVTAIAAIAAWTAREAYRVHLNDLGESDAPRVDKAEYDRLRRASFSASAERDAAPMETLYKQRRKRAIFDHYDCYTRTPNALVGWRNWQIAGTAERSALSNTTGASSSISRLPARRSSRVFSPNFRRPSSATIWAGRT
jgi:hypothetical protein